MNFNKVTSDLIFSGCSVKKLDVENKLVSISDNVEKSFGMDIVPIDITGDERGLKGKILMAIKIELRESDAVVSSIEMHLEGAFRTNADMEEEEFKRLVMINGAAALYSIARSKIEMVSAMTFLDGKLILPFVNIYDFYREKSGKSDEQ